MSLVNIVCASFDAGQCLLLGVALDGLDAVRRSGPLGAAFVRALVPNLHEYHEGEENFASLARGGEGAYGGKGGDDEKKTKKKEEEKTTKNNNNGAGPCGGTSDADVEKLLHGPRSCREEQEKEREQVYRRPLQDRVFVHGQGGSRGEPQARRRG